MHVSATDDQGILELDGQRYRVEITGEAEVIPGPISLIRAECHRCIDAGQPVDPKTILTIMENAGV
jgi:hypothetical protein